VVDLVTRELSLLSWKIDPFSGSWSLSLALSQIEQIQKTDLAL